MEQLSLGKCGVTGKTTYPTAGDAKNAMLIIKSKRNNYDNTTRKRTKRRGGKAAQCRYYACKHCGGFHLTSSPVAVNQNEIEKKFLQRVRDTEGLVKTQQEAAGWKTGSLPFPEQNKTQAT